MKYIVTLFLVCVLSFSAFASEESFTLTPALKEAKKRLSVIHKNDECEKTWSALWPLAKKDIYVRAGLYIMMTPMTRGDIIVPPSADDTVDTGMQKYHQLIMGVHSLRALDAVAPEGNFHHEMLLWLYEMRAREMGVVPETFFACVEDTQLSDCSSIALKAGIVPAFEDYAVDIDVLIEKGRVGGCIRDRSRHHGDDALKSRKVKE